MKSDIARLDPISLLSREKSWRYRWKKALRKN